ncbi:hypothetical protein F2Q68_00042401 [Brassica cretica]|uniref:RRM domain-containing protein n=1 Tax=Brassica cretica TaxID=69181 RepID=A0A8S9M9U4_BRACR|nr:hypothetical protein F2Q68_00042401 [Brassica cretica]
MQRFEKAALGEFPLKDTTPPFVWRIYAFVYFNDEDEEKALRLDGSDMGGRILQIKYAFVYFNDEDEEKALRLDGSDMGGRILQIKSYPFHETYLNHALDPMKEGVLNKSYIYLNGQEAVDKALERSGGLNLVVTKVEPIPKTPEKSGYIPPRIYARFKEQIDDPKLYFIIDPKSETSEGNQKKKKKTKTREGNQKKRSETTEGNQKKKGKTKEGNQKKKGNQKGVEISF